MLFSSIIQVLVLDSILNICIFDTYRSYENSLIWGLTVSVLQKAVAYFKILILNENLII